jgi:branched-chain amino acid transport system substrate-binding protein
MWKCGWRRSIEALAADRGVKRVYLLNQDYSFGQQVALQARTMLAEPLPHVLVVGDERHPVGRIRDFSPMLRRSRRAVPIP